MTTHPTDRDWDRLDALVDEDPIALRDAAWRLAVALAAAEHRIARLEAQTDIRGRAVVMYRERAREAEARIRDLAQEVLDERGAALDQMEQVQIRDARIKAVRELHSESRIIPGTPVFGCAECGEPNETEPCATIRALDGAVGDSQFLD